MGGGQEPTVSSSVGDGPFGLPEAKKVRKFQSVAFDNAETAKERIGAYLAGEIDAIEELDAPRLPLFGKEGEIGTTFKWQGASVFASPNVLT